MSPPVHLAVVPFLSVLTVSRAEACKDTRRDDRHRRSALSAWLT
jgi:hypothetical protein